jgi:hypothetical protein
LGFFCQDLVEFDNAFYLGGDFDVVYPEVVGFEDFCRCHGFSVESFDYSKEG